MDEKQEQAGRPALKTVADLAALVELRLLDAEMSDERVAERCGEAARWGLAAVMVRPSDVDAARRYLDGSGVKLASVAGWPHGASTTAAKLYELRDLVRRGVGEVAVVLNTGKLLSRQFQYVETELLQAAASCREAGVVLKVMLNAAGGASGLGEDLRVIGSKIVKRCEADVLELGSERGEFEGLVRVLKGGCEAGVRGVETVDEVLAYYELGAARMASERAIELMEEWRARLEAEQEAGGAEVISSLEPEDRRFQE